MSQELITVYYNDVLIKAIENISYATNMDYKNDLVANYYYTVSLNGYIVSPQPAEPEQNNYGIINMMSDVSSIKGIFSTNGAKLKVYAGEKLIFFAVDSKIKSINFAESPNNWSKYIPFDIEIDFNHLHMGEDLEETLSNEILNGADDPDLADRFHSPNILNIENHKIKDFSENFSMDINDNEIFNQINLINAFGQVSSKITNNYFSISYTLSATGKHDIYDVGENKTTLPAWEHAKRYVHRRLIYQIDSMFGSFLSIGGQGTLANIHANTGNGLLDLTDPLGGVPAFGIYNENLTFDVSESDGTFSVQYNAIVKRNCPVYEFNIGCSNNTLHTVTKQINRTFSANEETNLENQEITVSVNGEIKGLVPGRGSYTLAPFVIANPDGPYKGTFLLKQNTLYDKNDYAQQLLTGNSVAGVVGIFDPISYDLTEQYKLALGITPDLLAVNPNTILRPSKMTLTRNYLEGTINYNAEYNNKYNCSTSHYEVQLSVEMPTPVIAEFVIPNNNVELLNDTVCASGYSVIQKLGTQTAKKISVSINGNLGFDLGKCCLGSQRLEAGSCDESLDLLDLNYFSTQDFIIPSGVVIPIIGNEITGNNYVLVNKQKSTTFPKGDFSITLDYICADVCEVDYFEKRT
jgi:hypothetical protein